MEQHLYKEDASKQSDTSCDDSKNWTDDAVPPNIEIEDLPNIKAPTIKVEEPADKHSQKEPPKWDNIPENHEDDFEVDDSALAILLNMGFELGHASIILKRCNNNSDVALGILLNKEEYD